jgi:putative ABC transport system permease protein
MQGETAWREIVGIVSDVKQYSLDSSQPIQAYEPYAQMPFSSMIFILRTAADPATLSQSVRARILAVDKDQPVTAVRPLEEAIADSMGAQRFSTWLLSAFASIAVVLASVGLYGVMAYLVTQRSHEIGLRMALGAPRTNVFKMVIGQGMVLTAIGIAIGVAGALALTRLMATMLYEITTTDPLTFAAIPVILAVVAFFACYLPALRATKVDPMVALRTL